MFEIDQLYQEKIVKSDVSLLIWFNQNKELEIEPFDYKLIFGDESLNGKLAVWDCLFNAFPVAYKQFINTHPDRDFELSNPMLVRLSVHIEINQYRAVFEIAIDEDTGINNDLTDDDKAILLRAFYEFDDNIRTRNGLRLTPVEEKQKLYDQHFAVDKMPYMIADNVPNWEDRPPIADVELVDISEEMKAERCALRAMKKVRPFPTQEELIVIKQKASMMLFLHEERCPPLDLTSRIFKPPVYAYDYDEEQMKEIVNAIAIKQEDSMKIFLHKEQASHLEPTGKTIKNQK